MTGWRGKPIGQSRRNGAGGGECLLATRRFDAIESRSDCREISPEQSELRQQSLEGCPVFVVAR